MALLVLWRGGADFGFQIEEPETRWLRRAYWSACRAAKLKGINEALQPQDREVPGR